MENNTDSFIIFTMTPYWHKGLKQILDFLWHGNVLKCGKSVFT